MAQRLLGNRLSAEEMNRGVGMLTAGVSQRRVAEVLNVSQSVVFRMWNCYQTDGDASHRHGGGRTRSTTQRQDRFLGIQSRRQRLQNATALKTELRKGTGVNITTQSKKQATRIWFKRHEAGYTRVPLTLRHVQDRLPFARTQVRWTIRDWTPVLLTDESRFCLDFTDILHQSVWRMPNERFDDLNVS